MEPQDSRLTPGRIALAVLGALLLLPGLCGAVFMGGLLFEHLDRKSLEMGEFDLLVWLIAQPSYHFGCLVLYFIARQRGPGPWQSAARIAALAGLLARSGGRDAIVCLPGTHSKWVRLEKERVTGFATFMTGELYNFAASHSILSSMIAANAGFDPADAGFAAAVRDSFTDPASIANRLFSARPARLLGFCQDEAAAPATSGALIGLELAGARAFHEAARQLLLIASGRMAQVYHAAFEAIGLPHEVVDADIAVRAGLHSACINLWPETSARRLGATRA